jgi:hypothetical protein
MIVTCRDEMLRSSLVILSMSRRLLLGLVDLLSFSFPRVMLACYALLTMRPLSISSAEEFVVICCGKADYDKSGWQDDFILTPDVSAVYV